MVPAGRGEPRTAREVAVVAHLGPAPGRREHRGHRTRPWTSACSTPTTPPGLSSSAARTASTRIASRPSAPENSARCGSWSRASGATDSHASSGTYGGLQTTTSTVPSRSSKAVAKSPSRRSTPVPARLRCAQRCAASSSSTACTRACGHLVGERLGDRAGAGAQVDHDRGGRRPGRPRSPSRPAARSRAAARRHPVRPRARTCRNQAGRSGAGAARGPRAGPPARRTPRARSPATSSTRTRRGTGRCRARGRAARRRRAPGWRHRPRAAGPPRGRAPRGSAHSARAPRAGPRGPLRRRSRGPAARSPSRTWSRL